MKKRTAIWKKRRAGLSRKGRILRNLLLSLLLVLPLWWMADCPLGIPALEFHRLERENLVPRGKIFFSAVPLPWEHGVSQVELDGETFSL